MKLLYCKQILVCLIVNLLISCNNKENELTTISVEDPIRHYHPVVQGEIVDIVYKITNTGNGLLELKDILASCGCIVVEEKSNVVIPEGKEGYIHLQYNSNKNAGYVKHYVYLYGNIKDTNVVELAFDINVVQNSSHSKDYEELYLKQKDEKNTISNIKPYTVQ